MKRKRPKLIHGDRFTEKIFKPYVSAIGELALAWNDLHEKLGILFIGHFSPHRLASALWNSQQFDRPRRSMLKVVIENLPELTQSDYPRLRDDVLWLLGEVDKLEDARNTAIHSPLLLKVDDSRLAVGNITVNLGVPSVVPNLWLKNSRAMKLEQKDLLTEFRWCRDASMVLRDYALMLEYATMPEECPWPDRPSLPNRGQKRTRRSRRPPSPPK